MTELALVAPDGRLTGFDPATKRSLSQLPGANYYDTRGDDDKEMDAVAFGCGQVRRFAIQIGAGTMDVSELHSPEIARQ
jgi:hypothetical protein